MTHGGNSSWEMKPGTVLGADRFLLIEPLGQGGMGVVWLAHDQRLDEDVALKLVPPEIRTDAGALDDLRCETLRSRRLSHPNIIRLHDLNEFPGEPPFISMEFVDGQSVAALKSKQPERLFSWEHLRPLAKQLCDALDYAHSEKVIHRDLKPANMMVDRRGRLKLADFGLAAVVSELTSRVSIRANTSGTPAYMSPQQMDGRTPRVTDDIYALGATLYELLTSKPPFYHGDIPHQVRNLPPDSLEQRLADLELTNVVPSYVAALIMACLAKDPAQRPQSAAAVAEWLQLGSQTVGSALAAEIVQRSAPSPGRPAASPGHLTPAVQATLSETVEAPSGIPLPPSTPQVPPPAAKKSWPTAWIVTAAVALAVILAVILRPKPETTAEAGPPPNVSAEAVDLFNGRNLDGWRIVGPQVWEVENGVIKAASQEQRRSYLIWDGEAADFEIAFDYKPVRAEGNGHHGIFYRSSEPPPGGVASGLAMPLEPGPNNGVMLVGRNGDFRPQPGVQPVALVPNDWNRIRIRADGPHIVQEINGSVTYQAQRPDLNSSPAGERIAFEIWNGTGGGNRSVEIRNIRLQRLAAATPATSSQSRPAGAWEDLFISHVGRTGAFRSIQDSSFPSGSWMVENGILKSIAGAPQMDLFTKETYGDFEFQMMYEMAPGSNSGILYRALPVGSNSHDTAPEMQLIGPGPAGNLAPEQRTGALYGLLPATQSPGPAGPDGNYAEVRVQNGRVEHRINGKTLLSYDWNSPELRQRISSSNFKDPRFMKAEEGHIVIQHRGEIRIRNMRVRRL